LCRTIFRLAPISARPLSQLRIGQPLPFILTYSPAQYQAKVKTDQLPSGNPANDAASCHPSGAEEK
jgi:hypothetical protein